MLGSRAMAGDTISFARGAPSADILPHEAVREAAARALASDWEKALSYGTGIGHPGLCEWIAERHGGIDASQVMVANGSLEGGAMLFEHLLGPGDRVVVEQPTYDRTLLLLQRLGVELVPVPLEADGLDLAAFEAALAEGPIKLAHVIPNAHNPAGCTLSVREAGAAGRARRRARLLDLRGRPLPRAALRGRAAGDDALARQRRPGHPRLLLLEDGQPRRPGRLPGRARRGDREARQARQRDLHLAEHAGRVDRARALPLRRAGPQHRLRQGRAEGALRRAGRGAGRADPRGRVRRPRGRLLPLARPRRGHRHDRPAGRGQGRRASPSSPAPTS